MVSLPQVSAWCYIRVGSTSQKSGVERQKEACTSYCQEQGWDLQAEHIIVDMCSAFRQENLEPCPRSRNRGNLGRALADWESKTVLPPTHLVFESYTRLSAAGPSAGIVLIQRLRALGIALISLEEVERAKSSPSLRKIKPPHPFVVLKYHDIDVRIDEMLAPLIQEIWKAGIDTDECCQEIDPKMACIGFPHQDDCLRFMNICGDTSDTEDMFSMYNRMFAGNESGAWDIIVFPGDRNYGMKRRHSQFYFSIMVVLPQSDIGRILYRFQEHNEKKRTKTST